MVLRTLREDLKTPWVWQGFRAISFSESMETPTVAIGSTKTNRFISAWQLVFSPGVSPPPPPLPPPLPSPPLLPLLSRVEVRISVSNLDLNFLGALPDGMRESAADFFQDLIFKAPPNPLFCFCFFWTSSKDCPQNCWFRLTSPKDSFSSQV